MKKYFILKSDAIKQRAAEFILKLSGDTVYEVIIRPHKSNRSLQQNNLLHAWCSFISQQYAEAHGKFYPASHWKEYLKDLFLGQEVIEVNGKQIVKPVETSKLNVKDMQEFMDKVDHYCASELQIYLPTPEMEGM